MQIKPGISTSLYISMILFIAAFSGQNPAPNHAIDSFDITINSTSDSVIGKWKPLEYFQDSGYRIQKWIQTDLLNTHGTK